MTQRTLQISMAVSALRQLVEKMSDAHPELRDLVFILAVLDPKEGDCQWTSTGDYAETVDVFRQMAAFEKLPTLQ